MIGSLAVADMRKNELPTDETPRVEADGEPRRPRLTQSITWGEGPSVPGTVATTTPIERTTPPLICGGGFRFRKRG